MAISPKEQYFVTKKPLFMLENLLTDTTHSNCIQCILLCSLLQPFSAGYTIHKKQWTGAKTVRSHMYD